MLGARVIAQGRWPYVSSLLFTLRLVETPAADVPTMAVDAQWRLYYSVPFVLSCTAEQLATVVLHECQHLLLDHSARFDALRQPRAAHPDWNLAGDVVINQVLADARMPWPKERGVRYADLADRGVTAGMTTEAAFFALRRGPSAPPTAGHGGVDGGVSAEGPGGHGPGVGEDSRDQSTDAAARPPDAGPQLGSTAVGQASPRADCGSGAGGPPRPYEVGPGDEDHPPMPRAQQELVRGQVAQELIRQGRAQGDVPAGLLRWAEELLDPVVDWRRVLAGQIRSGVASAAGRQDFTFRFPSRRAHALRASLGGAVLPAMRKPPPPRVAVVIDTSGSISGDELRAMLTEVLGIVRAIGLESGLTVVPCDAKAYDPILVRRAGDVAAAQLPGGGGTDMGAGIAAALRLRPAPDVVVVHTDGFTRWPTEPPHPTARVVVALTGAQQRGLVPGWADPVILDRK